MNLTGPTIAAIQRTNIVLMIAASVLLALAFSRAAAAGCLIGAGAVIANLFLLAMLGRLVVGAASGGAMARRAGAVALALKLLLFVGLLYLAFSRVGIDAFGFAIGVLTQFLAILIETGRTMFRPAREISAGTEGTLDW